MGSLTAGGNWQLATGNWRVTRRVWPQELESHGRPVWSHDGGSPFLYFVDHPRTSLVNWVFSLEFNRDTDQARPRIVGSHLPCRLLRGPGFVSKLQAESH